MIDDQDVAVVVYYLNLNSIYNKTIITTSNTLIAIFLCNLKWHKFLLIEKYSILLEINILCSFWDENHVIVFFKFSAKYVGENWHVLYVDSHFYFSEKHLQKSIKLSGYLSWVNMTVQPKTNIVCIKNFTILLQINNIL